MSETRYEIWRSASLARGWVCFKLAGLFRVGWLLAHAGDWIYAGDYGRLDRRRKESEQ